MKDKSVELTPDELRRLELADEYLGDHPVDMFNCPIDQLGSEVAYQSLLDRSNL